MILTPKELAIPPTPLELARLLDAATTPDHQLTDEGLAILRRLMFHYDLLQDRTNPLIKPPKET